MATIAQLQQQIAALSEQDSTVARNEIRVLQAQLAALQNQPAPISPSQAMAQQSSRFTTENNLGQAIPYAAPPNLSIPITPKQFESLNPVDQAVTLNNLQNAIQQDAKQQDKVTFQNLGGEQKLAEVMAIPGVAETMAQGGNNMWQTLMPSTSQTLEGARTVGTLGALAYGGNALMEATGLPGASGIGGAGSSVTGTTAAMTPEAYAASTGAGYGTVGTATGLGTEGLLSAPAIAQTAAPAAGGLLSNAAGPVATTPSTTNWWESPQAWSTGLNMLGGYVQGQQATQAAQTAANAQIEAAKIAADAAKFRPVGVTSRFGQSQFGYDAKGNLISAGYNLSPEAKAQQDILMGISGGMLNQYQGAQAATAPMGAAGQQAMALGQGYLGTSPQAQAAQYMAEQQALLAPSREREMAALQNRLQAQGRGGLAVGGTSTGMMAANPELEAYYNAIRQQDLGLAAQSTQGGMDYAKFGAGMVGTGGDLLKSMYGTQAAAYTPYQTALGGATTLEGLGQQPMDLGINIGAKGTAANAQAGQLLAQGMTGAAQTMQPANAYTPWAGLLSGAAQGIGQYNQPQGQSYDPGKFRLVPL